MNTVIISGQCNKVQINIHEEYNGGMIINAPIDGDLSINVVSDGARFDNNIINSFSTNDIAIDCNGRTSSCQSNIINAESIQNSLNISCSNGANCDFQEIHCPEN